ncbi:MAG: CRISPR-associated helicase Cas3' [Patulibacter sp.]
MIRHGLLNGARGFYVGLPTKATAEQFHRRASAFGEALWPGADVVPQLLHSSAGLREPQPVPTVDDAPDREVRAEACGDAASWFAGKRRGLVAPAGVGTIDQALLGILRSKHHFVRLWGLQGKVVVFDEVHAYDAYTLTLLERAVEWLAALDSTVVLLSATLPRATRERLAAAFATGLGQGSSIAGVDVVVADAPYPRVLSVDADGAQVVAVADDRDPRRVLLRQMPLSPGHEAEDLAGVVSAAVEAGGVVAVVCNTVASAQERYDALRSALSGDEIELVLLHARLRPHERDEIERQLLDAAGPPAADRRRPRRMVVVATQIIEQSLDIDFDGMFTDLAPIDLLIQRAGRVHRHDRPGKDRHAHREPILTVLDTPGETIDREYLRASDKVYVPAVLQRTRAALRGRDWVEEPRDLDELIETVYGAGLPAGCSEGEVAAIQLADDTAEGDRKKFEREAEKRCLTSVALGEPPWEAPLKHLADADGFAAPSFAAQTRWTELPSITLVLLYPDELPSRARLCPGRDDIRDLLRRAVSVSTPSIVGPIREAWRVALESGSSIPRFQPPAWRENGHLRDCVLVALDAEGCATPFSDGQTLPLRYHQTLGVLHAPHVPAS